jgi:hypothetical protein
MAEKRPSSADDHDDEESISDYAASSRSRGRGHSRNKGKEKKWQNELVEAAIGLAAMLPPDVRDFLHSTLK